MNPLKFTNAISELHNKNRDLQIYEIKKLIQNILEKEDAHLTEKINKQKFNILEFNILLSDELIDKFNHFDRIFLNIACYEISQYHDLNIFFRDPIDKYICICHNL